MNTKTQKEFSCNNCNKIWMSGEKWQNFKDKKSNENVSFGRRLRGLVSDQCPYCGSSNFKQIGEVYNSEDDEKTQNAIMDALNWAYDKAVNGFDGILPTAQDLANNYMKEKGTLKEKVNYLIRWQNTNAATSGFVTGLGGLITLPVTLPANITSVFYVQLRMIAAIAIMGGYNPKDNQVQSMVYTCLTASTAADVAKQTGIAIGTKIATGALKKMPAEILVKINKQVGFRLLTKFGQKGIINLGKAIPLIGGIIGATFDAICTNTIGNVARDYFIVEE